MDGFGLSPSSMPGDNAIAAANTPHLDQLFQENSCCRLSASGLDVGLPDGQMGNSEVGHTNIGAGRVVFQDLPRISLDIKEGRFFQNPAYVSAMDACKEKGTALHLMGLLSDGGVHSSNEHLYALIKHAVESGVGDVRVHAFMDGRDVPPSSGKGYMQQLQDFIVENGFQDAVRVASVSGRYYAMDRDKRWDRVAKAYEAVVCATPLAASADPVAAMQASYDAEVTDEFVEPVALDDRGVVDGDAVVFFNFRPDRAREITRAIVDDAFDGFDCARRPQVSFVCLTEYDPDIPAPIAFPKTFPENVLADVLSAAGLRQYHIAETEKYAHVTFFLNGGREEPKAGEQRSLIPSPKVATYDLQPQMSEPEVADTLAAAIDADEADVYIVNFANPDMVGHTGVIPAAVAAVEAVDSGVGKVIDAIRRKGGFAFITADHGNCDKMIADDGTPHTAHTTAKVPFIFVDGADSGRVLGDKEGALCDIAPTLLDAMGLPAPAEMTGRSLFA